jgi:hypothetical protein
MPLDKKQKEVITEAITEKVSEDKLSKHYKGSSLQAIDIIEDWDLNFVEGNIVKYLQRYKFKGSPKEDLQKAKWYLNRLYSNCYKKGMFKLEPVVEVKHEN